MDIYSIGHSTRSFEDFAALLNDFDIVTLADIRRFPGSRRFPHFNRDHLERALPSLNVQYLWMQDLGGRRKPPKGDASPNGALRNASFRAYADYMQTPEFVAAIDELLRIAEAGRVAIMCSEAVYWRCHRRLVSDYLLTRGITVQHIMSAAPAPGSLRPHVMTEGGVIHDHTVTYPGADEAGTLFN